jgi:hypothetical protein
MLWTGQTPLVAGLACDRSPRNLWYIIIILFLNVWVLSLASSPT